MLSKLRTHLNFANAVSLVALIVALGGGAYAMTLPKSSVGPKQLKKDAVGSRAIRAGAVKSSHVRNGSLVARDFKGGTLPAGPNGEPGPK
jgi:hypothetical protein